MRIGGILERESMKSRYVCLLRTYVFIHQVVLVCGDLGTLGKFLGRLPIGVEGSMGPNY